MVVLFLNLIIFCSCMGILLAGGEDRGSIECPIWNFYNNITGQCECGSDLIGRSHHSDAMRWVYLLEAVIVLHYIMLHPNKWWDHVYCYKVFSYHHHLNKMIMTSGNLIDLNNEICEHYHEEIPCVDSVLKDMVIPFTPTLYLV